MNHPLLDVGTLLLLFIPEKDVTTITTNHQGEEEKGITTMSTTHPKNETSMNNPFVGYPILYQNQKGFLLPLGKILEVFGPVGNPLYALRFDQPTTMSPTNTSDTTAAAVTVDNEMIEDSIQTHEFIPQDTKVSEIDTRTDEDPSKQQMNTDMNQLQQKETPVEISSSITSSSVFHMKHSSKTPHVDLWNEKGLLTYWLQKHPNTQVFYFRDQAKIVDTKLVVQNSRKGCGMIHI